jgi:hypothetical protein
MTDAVTDAKAAADRIFKNIPAWAPPVPAPVDVKSVNWAVDRYHANWDGNQGASSRTLASGASATGDPRMVNVRIHEPLNPFINNLPAPPYPFRNVNLARAREGKGLFRDNCASCHRSRNETIYPAAKLGVDANRTRVNTSVSRYGLAALVTEACQIYGLNNKGQAGADWCVPTGSWQERLDEYFRDRHRTCTTAQCPRWPSSCVPRRVPSGSCAATCATTRSSSASNGPTGRRRGTARTKFCS